MSEIKKALSLRNDLYLDGTQKALALFSIKLDKAVQYFIKLDRDITWVTIEFVPGIADHVFVAGYLIVEKGDIVTNTEGKRIEVDEEFLKNNSTRTLVRLMLSIPILESEDPKELFAHIKDYYELSAMMGQEDIIKLLKDFKDIKSILEEAQRVVEVNGGMPPKVIETPEPVKVEDASFDLSLLSDEQRRQLRLHTTDFSKTKN
jgi:hypothetical protein